MGKDEKQLDKENYIFTDVPMDQELKDELNDLNRNPLIEEPNELLDPEKFDNLVNLLEDKDEKRGSNKNVRGNMFKSQQRKNLFSNLVKNSDPMLNFLDKMNVADKKDLAVSADKQPDEKILIDNEPFLKNQIDLIANKILSKCNYFSSKSKRNDNSLVKMNGKLMFTRGKPVREFVAEHNLNTIL